MGIQINTKKKLSNNDPQIFFFSCCNKVFIFLFIKIEYYKRKRANFSYY